MNRVLLLVFLVFLISCGNAEENREFVNEAPKAAPLRKTEMRFERITFSIYPGWRRERYSKDVEINHDSIAFYRQRDNQFIIENYKIKLDSLSMRRVYAVLDSIDFNSLKSGFYYEEDGPAYSLNIKFDNAEVSMRGTFEVDLHKKVQRLIEVIESQELVKSKNRHFSTAKDAVFLLPQMNLDSL